MKAFSKFCSLSDMIGGLLSGLLMLVISTAVTALIFKGPLTPYFAIGVGGALIGTCLINLILAKTSAFHYAIARIEPAPAAILAIIFANIASIPLTPQVLLPTLIATLCLGSLLVGASMFLLGYFRLGHIIRFLPYPVLGGVITGTAWIMARSSLLLMSRHAETVDSLLQPHVILQYALGLSFAVALLLTPKNKWRTWILCLAIIGLSFMVNLLLGHYHISHAQAIDDGWILPAFTPAFIVKSANLSMIHQIQWSAIWPQLGYLFSMVGVIIIISLLNVSSLETLLKEKANLDHELKITGIGNLCSGFLGGTTANLSFTGTLLNYNAGATHRASGLLASLFCVAMVVFYPDIISYLPKPIIGGLLFYIALSLLMQWLFDGWRKLPRVDYAIVTFILITIGFWGLLPGVITGIIITCLVFIIRYARIDSIKYATTGVSHRSNVIRPFYQHKWLTQNGKGIQIFKLHGYLFFGSAKILIDKVTQLVESDRSAHLHYIIFDFQSVYGIDSSASFGFIRLQQLIDNAKLTLILTHCSPAVLDQLKHQEVIADTSHLLTFPDLDQGLEWCENQLLSTLPETLKPKNETLAGLLESILPEESQQRIFSVYLTRLDIPAHHVICKQGDPADCLYFIERGDVSVYLEGLHESMRLSKSGAGTIVGEIAFYLNKPRTATVKTESDAVVHQLTQTALNELEKAHPDIALQFHKSIIHILALRVIQTNHELEMISQ